MNERDLREALRDAAPDDDEARERSWRVVRAAYASREPAPARRPWKRVAAAATTAVAAVGVAAAGAPDSGVGRWVRSAFTADEKPPARLALAAVPGGGRLLVQSGASAWAVASDGGKRRLGEYAGASWSPHGRFVVAWRGRELTAVEPNGRVRWSRAAPRPISVARWGRVDGFRIAYLAGRELRIVNGDGTGDRGYATARADVAPAWRPDAQHVLAYADPRGRVEVAAVDTRRRLWRSAPLGNLVALAWTADGERLVAATRRRVAIFDRAGRLRAASEAPAGFEIASAAAAPSGRAVAFVRQDGAAARSEVVLIRVAGERSAVRGQRADGAAAAGERSAVRGQRADGAAAAGERSAVRGQRADGAVAVGERSLFTGPGRLGAPAWSPDGRALLVPWPEADQWLFLRTRAGGRPAAVANIARQFTPGSPRPSFPRSVEWCCAATG